MFLKNVIYLPFILCFATAGFWVPWLFLGWRKWIMPSYLIACTGLYLLPFCWLMLHDIWLASSRSGGGVVSGDAFWRIAYGYGLFGLLIGNLVLGFLSAHLARHKALSRGLMAADGGVK